MAELAFLIVQRDEAEAAMVAVRTRMEEADEALDAICRRRGKGDARRNRIAGEIATALFEEYEEVNAQFIECSEQVERAQPPVFYYGE